MKARTKPLLVALTAGLLLGGVSHTFRPARAAQPPERKGKLNHIGLVWLKAPGNAADRQKIIEVAHLMAAQIPELQSLSVGQSLPSGSALNDSSFDICLTMQFEDRAAMDRYAQHPVHQKAAAKVFLPLASKILFYDFISE